MKKIADNTFLINKKGKYCPYCRKYDIRVTMNCRYCKGDWTRGEGRCGNCDAAIDLGWSYSELCGVETLRARRLKRAKMLSHHAKLQKVVHSELPPPPPTPPKSPDLFGPDPDIEELDSIESTLTDSRGQQSEKTPDATESTKIYFDADKHDDSSLARSFQTDCNRP